MSNNYKKQSQSATNFEIFYRVFREYIKVQSKHLVIAIVCMILISITTAINAWLMQPALDEIFLKHNKTMLYLAPIITIINTLVKSVAKFMKLSTMRMMGQKIVSDIQLRLYSHVINCDMRVLLEYPAGNLISRFTNDVNAMRKSTTDVLTGLVMECCTLIGLVGIMLYQSFNLAIVSILLLPVAFYPITKLGRKMRYIARNMQEELGDFTVRLDETFQNIRIIKSYCRESYEISRATIAINRVMGVYKKAAYIESISSPMMEALSGFAIAIVIWYGGNQVINGDTTPGAFFSFIAALLMAYQPMKTISQLYTSMQEGIAAARRLFTLIDEEIKIIDNPNIENFIFENHDIEFRNVYFSYNTEQKILDDLNMLIPSGKTIALVGTSGSGKTTILNLIERLYDPNYGSISISGRDIKKIRLQSLRESIALVSQEIALFDDTVWENIRYGRLRAKDEEVVQAAIDAAAHDFIVALPEGYNTEIGQNGVKLSGGQRQKIAIARAILKNAPILLLDEATSALDSISEKQIQGALEYLKKGRTTIMIAHRLSTIETADLIYLILDGKVAEYGSHKELIELGGEYANLYEKYRNNL